MILPHVGLSGLIQPEVSEFTLPWPVQQTKQGTCQLCTWDEQLSCPGHPSCWSLELSTVPCPHPGLQGAPLCGLQF